MTKRIRVENADTAQFKVVVQVWDKNFSNPNAPDILVSTTELPNPCDITPDAMYITDTRYLVVKEVK